jgi:hypothetical protein
MHIDPSRCREGKSTAAALFLRTVTAQGAIKAALLLTAGAAVSLAVCTFWMQRSASQQRRFCFSELVTAQGAIKAALLWTVGAVQCPWLLHILRDVEIGKSTAAALFLELVTAQGAVAARKTHKDTDNFLVTV